MLALHDITKSGDARVLGAVAKDKDTGLGQPIFSADGRQLTCSVSGSRVHVWDTATGAELYTVRGHVTTPAVAFTGGDHLLTAGREGTVKEWTQPTPRPQPADLSASNNYSPLAAAFTPNGLRLARAFLIEDGGKKSLEIRAWDEHGGALVLMKTPIPTEQGSAPRFQQGRDAPRGRLRGAGHYRGQAAYRAESVGRRKRQGTADGGQRHHCERPRRQPPGRPRRLGDRRANASLGRGLRQAVCSTRRSRGPCPCSRPSVRTARGWPGPGTGVYTYGTWTRPAKSGRSPTPAATWGRWPSARTAGGWPRRSARCVCVRRGEGLGHGRRLPAAERQGPDSVQDLAFNSDGSRLASFRWQHIAERRPGGVTIWDVAAGLPVLRLGVPAGYALPALATVPARWGTAVPVQPVPAPAQGNAYEVWDATPTAGASP